MSDLISRQSVLDEISKLRRNQQLRDDSHNADLVMHGLYLCEKVVEKLPSVQPRKGKITYTYFCEELWGQSSICSLCGCSWQISEDGEDNFCPNCGCRMEEGDAE